MQQTKHIYLRLIQESDVDFLLKLRLNPNLNQYLNQVSENRTSQIDWLASYKERESQGLDYYFVIVDKSFGDIGLVRMYDIDHKNKIFTWGSWILAENRPKYAAIESALLSFDFAFNELGLLLANIDVKLNNLTADNFYRRFGMSYQYHDEDSKYYTLTKIQYTQLKYSQYYKILIR